MLIATLPPYVGHRGDIIRHPLVHALRFNTVMPVGEEPEELLDELAGACGDKPLWLDLKTRQLRITGFAYVPFASVTLSHPIEVDLPAAVHFEDCVARAVRIVDGTRLVLEGRPHRVVGAGEPVNILSPSLRIEGFLTERDRAYVEAARRLGLHRYMLSFVESAADIEELRALDPDAEVVAKIEGKRGLGFVAHEYPVLEGVRLMAARDDLLINMGDDRTAIFDALAAIVAADPEAIAASRVLTSLEESEAVALGDLADVRLLREMGYRSFMLSDGLCFREKAFRRAMAVWERLEERLGAP